MINFRNRTMRLYRRMAEKKVNACNSEIELDKMILRLQSSASECDRIYSILMRAIADGDTEQSFRKACKAFQKATKEHVRVE